MRRSLAQGVRLVGTELQTTSAAVTLNPVTGELLDLTALSLDELAEHAGGQWELVAPSPTVGTDEYPVDELRGALRLLIKAAVITEAAASGALERRLVLTLAVPWDAELNDIAAQAETGVRFQIGGAELELLKADTSERPVKAGINKLRKIPDAAEVLDSAKVEAVVPRRRVKVTKKTKARA